MKVTPKTARLRSKAFVKDTFGCVSTGLGQHEYLFQKKSSIFCVNKFIEDASRRPREPTQSICQSAAHRRFVALFLIGDDSMSMSWLVISDSKCKFRDRIWRVKCFGGIFTNGPAESLRSNQENS